MIQTGAWAVSMISYGFLALLVHELGHAFAMLLRRSWDKSILLIPIPLPMAAKIWKISGGWGELMTILAGPVPGLLVGWSILGRAYLGVEMSDQLLDFALATVIVNGFTLLPFLPLDGGRLLDLGVLRKAPQLRSLSLILAGLVLLGIAIFTHVWALAALGVFLWLGLPWARRRSKLLPWFRANSKECVQEAAYTGLAIARERSMNRMFRGRGGVARLDEFIGLAQSKSLGVFGSFSILFILILAWVTPVILPALEIGQRGRAWAEAQAEAKMLSKNYLGSRPDGVMDPNAEWDLNEWQKGIAAFPSQPGNVFANADVVNAVRKLKWGGVGSWVD